MDIDVLKTELAAGHPDTGAYNADNQIAADELNAVNRTRQRSTVTGSEILNATDNAEFRRLGVTDVQRNQWLALCGTDSIDVSSGVAKALEASIFGAGTTTRSNLVALKTENISRATELGLETVKAGHVEEARR